MGENVIEQGQYEDYEEEEVGRWASLDPKIRRWAFMGISVLVSILLLYTLAHLSTWGTPALIGLAVIAGLVVFYKRGQANARNDLSYQERLQTVLLIEHHRTLSERLAEDGHSIKMVHETPLGRFELQSISPLTIPHGPIENYYGIEEEQAQKQIAAPVTSDHLDISPDFKPHADEVLSGRVTIFGVSGSGKSNTFATTAEELARLQVPLLIADTEDEYTSLASPQYLPNAQTVDSSLVTVGNAEEFGRHILDARLQAILNLTDYTNDEAAQVLINMIGGMWAWEEERPQDYRMSCMIMLDEASKWLPQRMSDSVLIPDIQNDLFTCISGAVVSRGRKRGIGAILANQRVATLNKDVLQPSVQILHRQTQDVDVKRYASMGISNDEVASLVNGEAFIFTAKVAKLRTRINRRRSPDGATTPGLASLRNGNVYGRNGSFQGVMEGSFRSFDEPVKPTTDNIFTFPKFPDATVKSGSLEVPEEWKTRIVEKLKQGKVRDEVRRELGLSGDQYWMVKVAADEYERRKRA